MIYVVTSDCWIGIMRRFVICTDHDIVFGRSYGEGCGGRGVWKVWDRGNRTVIVVETGGNKSLGRVRRRYRCKYKIDLLVVFW